MGKNSRTCFGFNFLGRFLLMMCVPKGVGVGIWFGQLCYIYFYSRRSSWWSVSVHEASFIAGFTKLGAGTFSITIIIIIIFIFILTHRLVRCIAPQGHDGSVQKL